MTLHGGSVFRVADLGPEFTTPMHRTRSIDYCIVLSGEVELVLRDAPCRFIVCMIEAQPVSVGGATLPQTL